jgi:hypothetical protein
MKYTKGFPRAGGELHMEQCARTSDYGRSYVVKQTMRNWIEKPRSVPQKIIRFTLGINFTLFVLFIVPFAHHWVDRGFRALTAFNLEKPAGRSLQVWLVGSTLLATGLLLFASSRNRKAVARGRPSEDLRFDSILVTSWWLIVLGSCAYAYMLGMGS